MKMILRGINNNERTNSIANWHRGAGGTTNTNATALRQTDLTFNLKFDLDP